MSILPNQALPLLLSFSPVFSQPTFQRFLVLLGSAILTRGPRTVSNLLRTVGTLAAGHISSYRRVFSKARWSMLRLSCVLTRQVLTRLPEDLPVVLVGDDTVFGHPGPHV